MKLPVPALAMTTSSDVTESLASRVLTAWAIEASRDASYSTATKELPFQLRGKTEIVKWRTMDLEYLQ